MYIVLRYGNIRLEGFKELYHGLIVTFALALLDLLFVTCIFIFPIKLVKYNKMKNWTGEFGMTTIS